MNDFPRMSLERGVDAESECAYRYVFGTNDKIRPHCHEFYEIFITVSGSITHLINGVKTVLPAGCLVFIRPDDQHTFIYENEKSKMVEYVNLAFSPNTAKSLFEYLSSDFPANKLLSCDMPPTIFLSNNSKKRILSQISELNTLKWENKKALKIRMRVILADIFSNFFSETSAKESDCVIPYWLVQTVREMEIPKNFIVGSKRMIELSGKSREHLSRCLQKFYNLSITEYINELRINYAANLLINSDNSIIDICFLCGFENLGYFYKIFKLKYSVTPAAFRKTQQIHL